MRFWQLCTLAPANWMITVSTWQWADLFQVFMSVSEHVFCAASHGCIRVQCSDSSMTGEWPAINNANACHVLHLCAIGLLIVSCRRSGYPFGTLVDFASDGAGLPIFCLSPLAIHARNLIEDPRCSLVVQMPGWTGLANARVTIFGDVYQLPADMQVKASILACLLPGDEHSIAVWYNHSNGLAKLCIMLLHVCNGCAVTMRSLDQKRG